MNIGVMLAAGMGSRYGTEIPKQYVMVRGRELIYYNIDAFKKSKLLDDYIVMVNEKVHISKKIETYYDVKTIVGGATRNESIGKALDWIKENYGGKEPINVFINDVARPMLTSEMIDQYIGLLEDFEYVITCSDIRDALFSKEGIKLPNRKDCFLAAAPEAYRSIPRHASFL